MQRLVFVAFTDFELLTILQAAVKPRLNRFKIKRQKFDGKDSTSSV